MCQKKIMRKRSSDHLSEGPPKKRISPGGNVLPMQIPYGEILTDLTGKQWKLGKTIGHGGFGEIYLASENIKDSVKSNASYVVKVECHSNGPLFVEINCLLRIARQHMITKWKKDHKIDKLGMPHYVASGSHIINNEKLRFLILPRFSQDLEKIFLSKNKKFNLKTVLLICIQIMNVLEYIHSQGYVHCDIKASNILHSLQTTSQKTKPLLYRDCNPIRSCRFLKPYCGRNLRNKQRVNYDENQFNDTEFLYTDELESCESNQIIVIDYGLATKYRQADGRHKQYRNDERKAHAGTMLFCSTDAHRGASSRRSDMESVGYNMIYWLTSVLPWADINNPETVQQKKEFCLNDIDSFIKSCFSSEQYPVFLYEYFNYVKSLTFEAKPDYMYCKKLFQNALKDYGYKNDGKFDFDNLEGWGQKPKNINSATKSKKSQNTNAKRNLKSARVPLTSNISNGKPILRTKSYKKLKWSKLLAADPEEILRQNNKLNRNSHDVTKFRERKLTDSSDTSTGSCALLHLNIDALNPTYAMLDVYNKCRDKNANYNMPKNGNGDGFHLDHCKGYTPAMDMVLTKMNQQRLEELEAETENRCANIPTRITRKTKINDKKKVQKHTSMPSVKHVSKLRKHRSLRLRGYGLRG